MTHEKHLWKPSVAARRILAMRRTRVAFLSTVLGAAICGLGLEAQALTVTHTVAPNTVLTPPANFTNDTTGDAQATSSTQTLFDAGAFIPDANGAVRQFAVRYSALLAADTETATSASTGTLQASYRVQFTVTVGAGVVYDLRIDTRMFGALTLVDEGSGKALANISNSTGTYTGSSGIGTAGSLNSTVGKSTGNTSNAENTQFLDNDIFTVTGLVGTQNFTLDFAWTMRADSNDVSGAAGNEAAVRMGISNLLASATADDYPGVGSRTLNCTNPSPTPGTPPFTFGACDGHFATVTVTETDVPDVPLPAALSLLSLGVAGMTGVVWRRRRQG
jgi:hypothetical protein